VVGKEFVGPVLGLAPAEVVKEDTAADNSAFAPGCWIWLSSGSRVDYVFECFRTVHA
jgi:hypothetical protein